MKRSRYVVLIGTKLWNEYGLNKEAENLTVGRDYILDQGLVPYDCVGSIAHAKMLESIGLLTKEEAEKIVKELQHIIGLARKGEFKIGKEQEDYHTAIDNYLTLHLEVLEK